MWVPRINVKKGLTFCFLSKYIENEFFVFDADVLESKKYFFDILSSILINVSFIFNSFRNLIKSFTVCTKNASPISLGWLGDYFDEDVYEFSFKLV